MQDFHRGTYKKKYTDKAGKPLLYLKNNFPERIYFEGNVSSSLHNGQLKLFIRHFSASLFTFIKDLNFSFTEYSNV